MTNTQPSPKPSKSIVLYDAGGIFIFIFLFGIPFGTVFDYLWNLAVLSLALRFLPDREQVETSFRQRIVYCLMATVLGLVIDWAYFELTWDTDFGKYAVWFPAMSQGLQFVWLLLPMVMLFLVNTALAYAYLKLEKRQAVITGVFMAVLTAPWVLPTVPYLFGWVQ